MTCPVCGFTHISIKLIKQLFQWRCSIYRPLDIFGTEKVCNGCYIWADEVIDEQKTD